jgi:hypothetical protein
VVTQLLSELDPDGILQGADRHGPSGEIKLDRAQRHAVKPHEYLSMRPVADRQSIERLRQLKI